MGAHTILGSVQQSVFFPANLICPGLDGQYVPIILLKGDTVMIQRSGKNSIPLNSERKQSDSSSNEGTPTLKLPNNSVARSNPSDNGKKTQNTNSIPNSPLESNSKNMKTKDCETKPNDLPWRSKYQKSSSAMFL